MTITIKFIKEKIAYFNDLCFDGALPQIPVNIIKNRRYRRIGCYCRYYFGSVFLHNRELVSEAFEFNQAYDGLTERDWEDVIIHEMIHQYIHMNNIIDSGMHGREFMRIAAEINQKFGRDITAGYGKPNCFIDNRTICLCRAHDHWCLLACKEEEIDKARKMIDAKHDIVHVYWITDSESFLSYSHISQKIKWYGVKEALVKKDFPKTYALYQEHLKKEKWKIRPAKW